MSLSAFVGVSIENTGIVHYFAKVTLPTKIIFKKSDLKTLKLFMIQRRLPKMMCIVKMSDVCKQQQKNDKKLYQTSSPLIIFNFCVLYKLLSFAL